MKLDWISIIVIGVMICCTIVLGFYYYTHVTNECVSNPFTFGANKYSEIYGHEMYGVAYFLVQGSPAITFDSKNITFAYN